MLRRLSRLLLFNRFRLAYRRLRLHGSIVLLRLKTMHQQPSSCHKHDGKHRQCRKHKFATAGRKHFRIGRVHRLFPVFHGAPAFLWTFSTHHFKNNGYALASTPRSWRYCYRIFDAPHQAPPPRHANAPNASATGRCRRRFQHAVRLRFLRADHPAKAESQLLRQVQATGAHSRQTHGARKGNGMRRLRSHAHHGEQQIGTLR